MKVALILPCYNESKNLLKIRHDFLIHKKIKKNLALNLIIVNNGSTDDTHKVLLEQKFSHKNIFIINIKKNKGYGYGIKEAIKNVKSDIYLWAHGDLQTPMIDIIYSLKQALQTKSKIAAAHRLTTGFQKFQSRVFDFIISMTLGFEAYDINAQPKIFPSKYKNFFTSSYCPDDFALDMYFFKVFHDLNDDISRFEVKFEDRTEGEAKGGQSSIMYRLFLLFKMCRSALKIRKQKLVNN